MRCPARGAPSRAASERPVLPSVHAQGVGGDADYRPSQEQGEEEEGEEEEGEEEEDGEEGEEGKGKGRSTAATRKRPQQVQPPGHPRPGAPCSGVRANASTARDAHNRVSCPVRVCSLVRMCVCVCYV